MFIIYRNTQFDLPCIKDFLILSGSVKLQLFTNDCSWLLQNVNKDYAEIPFVYVLMPWQCHQPSRPPPAYALKSFSSPILNPRKWSRGSVNMEVWFAASREINSHPWHWIHIATYILCRCAFWGVVTFDLLFSSRRHRRWAKGAMDSTSVFFWPLLLPITLWENKLG